MDIAQVRDGREPSKLHFMAVALALLLLVFANAFAQTAWAGTYDDYADDVKTIPKGEFSEPDRALDLATMRNKVWNDLNDSGIYFKRLGFPKVEQLSMADPDYDDLLEYDENVFTIEWSETQNHAYLCFKPGQTDGTYTIRWANRGFTADGKKVSLVLKVHAQMKDADPQHAIHVFRLRTQWFESGAGADDDDGGSIVACMKQTATMYFYQFNDATKTTTNKKVQGAAGFFVQDLDVPDRRVGKDDAGYWAGDYVEAITLKRGLADNATIYVSPGMKEGDVQKGGDGHVLQSDAQGGRKGDGKKIAWDNVNGDLRFHATHQCGGCVDSSFSTLVESGFKFVWTARGAGTGMGLITDQITPADFQPQVKKVVKNSTVKPSSFSFTLTETDKTNPDDNAAKSTKKPNNDGLVTFPKLTFKQTGTYTYNIVEDTPTISGSTDEWKFDTHTEKLTVVVTAEGAKLEASAVYSSTGNETIPTFTNTHVEPPSAPGKKVDKATSYKTDTLHYTVEQEIPDQTETGRYIRSIKFIDRIPDGIDYVNHTFRVLGFNGGDITDSAGVLSTSDGKLVYTFDGDYVSSMRLSGGTLTFEFDAKVTDADPGDRVTNRATTRINSYVLQTGPARTDILGWYLSAVKKSSYPEVLDGNPAYSLEGTVFEVRDELDHLWGTLTTGADGRTPTLELKYPGTYRAIEVTPPAGHKLSDPNTQTVVFDEGNLGQGGEVTVTFTNEPLFACDEFGLIAVKSDIDYYFGAYLGENSGHIANSKWWQGNTPDFSACKVRVELYTRNAVVSMAQPLASAVFQADELGRIAFADATPVDGTTWRYRYHDRNIMPIGHVVVTEVNPPVGYVLNGEAHEAFVLPNETSTGVVVKGYKRWVEFDWDRVFGWPE